MAAKAVKTGPEGRPARLPWVAGLKELALSLLPGSFATVYADASSKKVWGATLGDQFIQGEWFEQADVGGLNWKELWAAARALETRHDLVQFGSCSHGQ